MNVQKRTIGPLLVSPIGMGCMGLSHGYGAIPEKSYSLEAIRKAYAFGCTFFDTAEAYGPNLLPEHRGHNELLLGEALKDFRSQVVLATKLHLEAEEVAAKGVVQSIREHLLASLKRLATDYVDLYYLHRVNLAIPVEEVAQAMGIFLQEGLIRGWGLSQVPLEIIQKAHAVTPLAAVQNIYSMLERSVEAEVLPFLEANGIGLVPFSPVASGFLSGKVNAKTDFSHTDDVRKFVPQLKKDNLEANQPVLDLLAEYAAKKKATLAQIALAWLLGKGQHVVPIPGSKNQERILENLAAWDVELSRAEFLALEAALGKLKVHGARGHVEFAGQSMQEWDRKK